MADSTCALRIGGAVLFFAVGSRKILWRRKEVLDMIHLQIKYLCLLVACTASTFSQIGWSAEWGNLKGRFIYDGSPPAPKKLVPTNDVAFCGKHKIPDERLIVNPENQGIADIVIYLRRKPSRISPVYDATATAEVTLDNIDCRFEPHVQLVRSGQTLVIGNKDAVGHNTNFTVFANSLPNSLVPALGSFRAKLTETEPRPAKVACNIHPWMSAVVVIKDHPYTAKTDKNGYFEIKHLPVGENMQFQFWHETAGYVRKVTGAKAKVSKKGRVKLNLDGDFDLGEIKVPPAIFE